MILQKDLRLHRESTLPFLDCQCSIRHARLEKSRFREKIFSITDNRESLTNTSTILLLSFFVRSKRFR